MSTIDMSELFKALNIEGKTGVMPIDAKIEMKPIEFDSTMMDMLGPTATVMDKVIEKARKQVDDAKKKMVIDRLNQLGFVFGTEEDFLQFIKKRTSLVYTEGSDEVSFLLDRGKREEQLICIFFDPIRIEFVAEKDIFTDYKIEFGKCDKTRPEIKYPQE